MKKFTIIGAIIMALLIGTMSTFFMLKRMAPEVQQDAQVYIETNIPQIISNWNSEELIKRASPSLLKAASRAQFTDLFKTLLEKLGPLREYKGSRGETTVTISFTGINRKGTFESEAFFANSPAVILCRIIRLNGSWKIDEFRVNSDALNQ